MYDTRRETWNHLQKAEPRLLKLRAEAARAVAAGTSPDEAYTSVKPFIAFLVGWRRGGDVISDHRTPLQRRFAMLVSAAPPAQQSSAELDSDFSYQVVVEHFYDALVAVARFRDAA